MAIKIYYKNCQLIYNGYLHWCWCIYNILYMYHHCLLTLTFSVCYKQIRYSHERNIHCSMYNLICLYLSRSVCQARLLNEISRKMYNRYIFIRWYVWNNLFFPISNLILTQLNEIWRFLFFFSAGWGVKRNRDKCWSTYNRFSLSRSRKADHFDTSNPKKLFDHQFQPGGSGQIYCSK